LPIGHLLADDVAVTILIGILHQRPSAAPVLTVCTLGNGDCSGQAPGVNGIFIPLPLGSGAGVRLPGNGSLRTILIAKGDMLAFQVKTDAEIAQNLGAGARPRLVSAANLITGLHDVHLPCP